MKQNSSVVETPNLNTKTNETKQKQPLWKLVVLIVSLSIIGAIIVTIITFACVPVSLKPLKLSYSATLGIDVYPINGTQNFAYNNEEYVEIVSKFESGFKTNFLTSFTEGLNKKNKYVINYYNTPKNYSTITSDSASKYVLRFRYGKDQTLYQTDGEPFQAFNKDTKFIDMVVILTEENKSFGAVDIWFMSEGTDQSYVNLTGYGKFKDLIKYLDNLTKEF